MNDSPDGPKPSMSPPAPTHGHPTISGRVIPSGDLFGHEREVLIEHQGSYYRLRLTRAGKLILHK